MLKKIGTVTGEKMPWNAHKNIRSSDARYLFGYKKIVQRFMDRRI